MRKPLSAQSWPYSLLAGATGVYVAIFKCNVGMMINPSSLTWLFQGDYFAYAFGWLFYRNAPWSLPLGQLPNLFVPQGTSVGFCDAIPWLAVLFRPFSALLPETFQYFGLWALACFAMQGAFAAWVAHKLIKDGPAAALIGSVFAFSYPLQARMGHLALLGQFLVVVAVGLGLVPTQSEREGRRRLIIALGLIMLAAGIHPYLFAMTFVLAVALLVRELLFDRQAPRRLAAGALLGAPLVGLFTLWLLGYFSGPRDVMPAEGFGSFSADLLTLFNSWGHSRFLPALGSASGRQHEGTAYLGLGMMLLAALPLVRLVWRRPALKTLLAMLPTVLGAAALFTYALSNIVTVGGKQVLDLSALYAPLTALTGAFRTSGRFSWALHALVVWLGIAALRAVGNRWVLRGVVAAALVAQVADIKIPTGPLPANIEMEAVRFHDPAWKQMSGQYTHLALYPFELQWVCRFDTARVLRFGYEAYVDKLTFNSGLIGRVAKETPSQCDRHFAANEFDEQTVYVPVDQAFANDLLNAGFVCGLIEGAAACASPKRETPFLTALRARQLQLK